MSSRPRTGSPGFVYLNRDDRWLDFRRRHLDIDRGRLRLASLPAVVGSPATADQLAPPEDPAGVAVAPDGSIFFTDGDRIHRIDGCDGDRRPVACIGGSGEWPTSMRNPRGLAVHPGRGALVVADTGNRRVQLFSLTTYELLDIWDGAPVGFDAPCAVAVDPRGGVYVVDRGARRVVLLSADGALLASFGDALAAATVFDDPVAIAVGGDGASISVLDRGRRMIVVVDPTGNVREQVRVDVSGDLFGIVGDETHVGSNAADGGTVVRLARDGSVVGRARGYEGFVAGLVRDGNGDLLVHTGNGAPSRLASDAACADDGIAWGGPFGGFSPAPKSWYRLAAALTPLADGDHVQFFVHTTDDPATAPPVDEAGPDHFPPPAWTPAPPDLGEFLLSRPPSTLAWVAVRFTSEGTTSPVLDQVKLEFDHTGYVQHLPAIYRADDAPSSFLARYLALGESAFTDLEEEIAGVQRTLDPAGADGAVVTLLQRWMGVDREAWWDEAQTRDAIADAYADSARRGTVEGLRAAIRRHAGVDVVIEEPLVQSQWWALAAGSGSFDPERQTSVLGVTTMLAGAEPQGAVLGSTATIERSHLIGSDEYGVPLFDGVAHRFVVRVFGGVGTPAGTRQAVAAVLEREAPAHTEWTICDVEPGLEIGLQGRIGIDAIIGGDLPPSRLGPDAVSGETLVLGGAPPGRIGEGAVVGVKSRLGG